ncbi:MAG: hypothetical protein ABI443_03665 [Chthoniobacterales bacterium]
MLTERAATTATDEWKMLYRDTANLRGALGEHALPRSLIISICGLHLPPAAVYE